MLVRGTVAFLSLIALVVATTFSSVASAQSERNKEIAREKFEQGVKAYDTGDYEEARTLFLQAYALTRHPLVLLNLGQSELKSGRYEDAGNHLQQFLREEKTANDSQKADAKKGIAEAKKNTGFIIVIADTDGAELAIDGTSIGKSPLADPYFVKPGKHVATAKKGNKSAKSDIDVQKGTATPVTLNLSGGGGLTPVPPPVPSPTPTPTPYPTQPTMPAPYPPPMPPPGFGPGRPPGGDTGRQGFFEWGHDKVGFYLLSVGVVGGLIGTVVSAGFAGHYNSNASSFSDQILTEVQRGEDGKAVAKLPPQFWSNGDGTGTPQPCGTLDDPNTAFGHYEDACNDLRAEIDNYDDALIGVAVMVPVFVLSTAGLIIYYFVDSDREGSAKPSFTIVPTPIITGDTKGGGLVGTF